jgi:bla regulator protein BlaR1
VDAILELGLFNGVLVAALAMVVACVTWLCRRPALAHALWLLVLMKLVTPPFVPVTIPRPEPLRMEVPEPTEHGTPPAPQSPVLVAEPALIPNQADDFFEDEEFSAVAPTESVLSEGRRPPESAPDSKLTESSGLTPAARPFSVTPPAPPFTWQTAVAAVWLAGSCLWWCLAAWRLGRFRRLLREARPASPAIQARAQIVTERLGLSRCPNIRLLPAPLPPFLWSVLGPAFVFLPEQLWAELTAEQQDALLAHELAHYQRRDHWVRWLELLALGLYWWHPAAWLARRGLHDAEELLCDARVLRALPAAADAYAQALIHTVAFLSGPRLPLPGAASGMGQIRPLKARLTMIMRGTNADRLPKTAACALVGLGMALLVLRPVWASTPASAAPDNQAPAVEQPTQASQPVPAPDRPARETSPVEVRPPQGLSPQVGAFSVGQPGVGTAPFGGGARAEPSAEMKEQMEMLRVQLAGKEAELHEARAMLKLAHQRLKRLSQMHRSGNVGQDEFEQAQAEAEVQQARVQGKEAQVREAQLRLSQTARRLQARSPIGGGGGAGYPALPGLPSGSMTPPGAGARMAGPGGAASAAATPAPANVAQPGETPPYRGRPGGRPAAPGSTASQETNANTRATEQRLDRLEMKLEKLLNEVQALRSQISESRRRVPGERSPESSLRRQPNPDERPSDPTSTAPEPRRK